MHRLQLLLVIVLGSFAFLSAHADTVEYSVTINSGGFSEVVPYVGTYTFFEPTVMTDTFDVTSSDLASSTNSSVYELELDIGGCAYGGAGYSCVIIDDTQGQLITFVPTADTYGTFLGGDFVDLTITDVPSAATPEPSSIALLGTGALGIVGAIRRRFV